MSSNWFLYGPFPFEASAVSGSARAALAHLVEQYQSPERWSQLHKPAPQPERPGRAVGRRPGIYLIMRTEDAIGPLRPNKAQDLDRLTQKPQVAGFWVVFGRSYLGEGVVGPPDKEPPYIEGVLDACTEEVWWNNLEVYPGGNKTWRPSAVFEWPSELAFRSSIAPPGIPLSPDEIADPDEEEKFGAGDWLESLDEEVIREERKRAEQLRMDNPWLDLPPQRSVLMLAQGFLQRKRASHEGTFRMVHPEWLGSGGEAEVLEFDFWMDRLFSESAPERTEAERHYLGQPLQMPGGHVGFPVSGWLTRSLNVWPPSPIEIRKGKLSPRDIGSKFIAQFKQASVVTLMVLFLLVGLSWIVFILTKPPLVAVKPPPEITPEPAMSVCSADHQKFMDEFRCQIEAFAYGVDTDAPVCGDKGSKVLTRTTAYDLQAEYCGLLHRGDDGWKWPGGAEQKVSYNFGYVAASKACFNVLGHPYNYKLPQDFSKTARTELPNPDLFLNDPDLSIRGLSLLISKLDSACDVYRDRVESQVSGAVFATHVGTRPATSSRSYEEAGTEGSALRLYLADKATQGTKRELRDCFYDGMDRGVSGPKRMAELCGFLPGLTDEEAEEGSLVASLGELPYSSQELRELRTKNQTYDDLKVWRELYGDGHARSILDVTNNTRQLTSVVERYDYARFGNPLLPNQGERLEALWACHGDLMSEPNARLDVRFEKTLWDLAVPVPNTYRIEGAGVKTQLSLDAALRAFATVGGVGDSAGSCWQVTARRLSKYTPVHPLLAELDPAGWPSVEQQVCGQVCAAKYRVQARPPAGPADPPLSAWVTPERDLDMCVTTSGPATYILNDHIRRVRAINVESAKAEDEFKALRERLVRSMKPSPEGSYTPFGGGGTLDQLRVPWNNRTERASEQLINTFTNAVRRSDPAFCDRLVIDESLYLPLSSRSTGSAQVICSDEYRSLTQRERGMCDRYFQMSRQVEDLKAECRVAARVGGGRSLGAQALEDYLFARIQLGEAWLSPSEEQICAFNLIAQGFVHDADDALLYGSTLPPAWAGQTRPNSRIAGGGLGAKEGVGKAYEAANDMSRFGRTRSRKSCSYAATQCFTEKFLEISGDEQYKPFDWKDEWNRSLARDIDQLDRRGADQLKELSPWCALVQPYVNLEPGDIDYPCASGVDEARKSVSRAIGYLATTYQGAETGAKQ